MPIDSLKERWIAIGDSAMCFDPLSSQGMITAISASFICVRALHFLFKENSDQELQLYSKRLENAYNKYLDERKQVYSKETRWIGETFWSRRI